MDERDDWSEVTYDLWKETMPWLNYERDRTNYVLEQDPGIEMEMTFNTELYPEKASSAAGSNSASAAQRGALIARAHARGSAAVWRESVAWRWP